MSEELRKIHREDLRTHPARLLYTRLCRERKRDFGALDGATETIIYNACVLEDTMAGLRADIKTRGEVETIVNGRQHFKRQNKSVYELARVAERQTRLLSRLNRAGPEAAGDEEPDGLDEFT